VDNSNNETMFIIERSTSAVFTPATTTAFTVTRNAAQSAATGAVTLSQTNLLRATTYYYRILARNVNGDSVWVDLNLNLLGITTP
jgi:hypothetical protein